MATPIKSTPNLFQVRAGSLNESAAKNQNSATPLMFTRTQPQPTQREKSVTALVRPMSSSGVNVKFQLDTTAGAPVPRMQTLFGGVPIEISQAPRQNFRPSTAVRESVGRKSTEYKMLKMSAKVKPHLMMSGTSLHQTKLNQRITQRPKSGVAGFSGNVHHGHVLSSKTLPSGGLMNASGTIPLSQYQTQATSQGIQSARFRSKKGSLPISQNNMQFSNNLVGTQTMNPASVVQLTDLGEHNYETVDPQQWGFYNTPSTNHIKGKYKNSRLEKQKGRGNYLSIHTEMRKSGFRLNSNDTETNLEKVFMQTTSNPCPTKYSGAVKHLDWKDAKNTANGGKMSKKARITFTQDVMRQSKEIYATKSGETFENRVINEGKVKVPCPGFYKDSEKPKDNRILGGQKYTTKDARPKGEWIPGIVIENKEMPDTSTKVYATPAPNQKTRRDGVTHKWQVAEAEIKLKPRTPKFSYYPKERKDNLKGVFTGPALMSHIKKDSEPGPGSYDNKPVMKKSTVYSLGKQKKISYMEKLIIAKKAIPGPSQYKDREKAMERRSIPLTEFQRKRLV